MYNVTKYFKFKTNAVLLNFLFIKSSWKLWFPLKYLATQLISTLLIRRYVSWASNQNIRMISEGSCDTEDWSNDAENSALITEINCI